MPADDAIQNADKSKQKAVTSKIDPTYPSPAIGPNSKIAAGMALAAIDWTLENALPSTSDLVISFIRTVCTIKTAGND